MKQYKVKWEIDIEAEGQREAAIEAFRHMQEPGTTANVFSVRENRPYARAVTVDLQEELPFGVLMDPLPWTASLRK